MRHLEQWCRLELAKRGASDWMEEFDSMPDANSAADLELEFIELPIPSNDISYGWRQKAADFQQVAHESLGMSN